LLSNAIKFSAGGVVAITTRRTTLGGVEHLVFEISDTGIGMTEEQLERVFKPFEQGDASTTRKFGGTGLGLSIVQGLVGLLGGTITASSVLGSGSTFTLRLPVDLDAARNNANVSLSSRAA
jgi:signal transduction histidine kinase